MNTKHKTVDDFFSDPPKNSSAYEFCLALEKERDQLRVQLATWTTAAEVRERAIARLNGEADQLRSDIHVLEKLHKEMVLGAGLLAESHYATIKDFRAKAEKYLAALHQCYVATGEEAGDIDDFRALVDHEKHTVEAVKNQRKELDRLYLNISTIA